MTPHKSSKAVLFSLALLLAALPAAGLDPLFLQIKILGLREAGPPELIGTQVLFTYRPDCPTRLVGARFEHEDFRFLHPYQRNEEGVFFLLLELPEGLTRLKYRLVVDGLWMPDPANPGLEEDREGIGFSLLELAAPERPILNPGRQKDGSLTFSYKSRPGRMVTLTGTFNHWDPFADRLEEVQPGCYRINLSLLPGRYFYTFMVDGERLLDPYNMENARDYEGYRVSTFLLEPGPR